jgi:hypothetical protein
VESIEEQFYEAVVGDSMFKIVLNEIIGNS